jgi:uncharacterized SAM-binding protein YcdF (DUF218 family)
MREILENLVVLPMPLVLMAVVGLIFWAKRGLSLMLFTLSTLLLVIFSMPITGRGLEAPLADAARPYDKGARPAPVAIVVPTAGIFEDITGGWWASSSSIRRAVAARALQRQTGLPLLLIGGTPKQEKKSEAAVVAHHLGLSGPSVITETKARDTAETARAAARMVAELDGNAVILVTSPSHVARMAAALRHQGLFVTAVPTAPPDGAIRAARPGEVDTGLLMQFVPSANGMARSSRAMREYVAILWYIIQGDLRIADVIGG